MFSNMIDFHQNYWKSAVETPSFEPSTNFYRPLKESMIPREIPKKNHQIQIRTDRLISEMAGVVSFQPSEKFRRIPCTMENRNHNEVSRVFKQREVNRIRPVQHFDFLSGWSDERKSLRVFGSFVKNHTRRAGKFLTDAGRLRIIPGNRFVKLGFGLRLENHPKYHCLARYRFSMSSKTSSIGRQRSGCARASAARRSSSAICSGVRSSLASPNSRRILSTISCCSAGGRRRICSRISVALIELN
jgi:hypothetical protein